MDDHFEHARTTDPATSHDAARSACARVDNRKAARVVLAIMRDNVQRIDEEICSLAIVRGHKISPQRLRAGRKELSDRGILIDTGQRRQTRYGSPARVLGYYPLADAGLFD